MASAVPVYEEHRMSIGRTFQRAFSAMIQNPAVVFGLALVVGALPGLLISYLFVQFGLMSPTALQSGAISFRTFIGAAFVSSLVGFVIAALVQGSLTRAVVTSSEGGRASFAECLSTGLSVILPVIGLSLVFGIGVFIGFVLLVVPGIILLLMWAVAVPVIVVERVGIFEALKRSAELTKGSRWKIFGLFLVLLVAYWLLSVVLGLVGLRMYTAANARDFGAANLIGSVLLGTVFNVIWGTIQPSLYVELRQTKEGESVEDLERVFA